MALGKIDPKSVFKTCSTLDPAIDNEATGEEGIKQFEESYNMKFLKFKENEHPTVFHIMNILSTDEAKIKQDHLKIEFPELEDASEQTLKTVKVKELKPKITQVKSQEMMIKYFNNAISVYSEKDKAGKDQSFPCNADIFPYTIVQEMGSLVMMRTQVGEDLKNAFGS